MVTQTCFILEFKCIVKISPCILYRAHAIVQQKVTVASIAVNKPLFKISSLRILFNDTDRKKNCDFFFLNDTTLLPLCFPHVNMLLLNWYCRLWMMMMLMFIVEDVAHSLSKLFYWSMNKDVPSLYKLVSSVCNANVASTLTSGVSNPAPEWQKKSFTIYINNKMCLPHL